MKNLLKKELAVVTALLMALCAFTACGNTGSDSSSVVDSTANALNTQSESVTMTEFSTEDLDSGYDESSAVTIELNETSAKINGKGATEKDGVVTIDSEGVYVLSGKLTDGRIIVDTDKKSKVHLVLNGTEITCSDNAAIFVKKASKVFVTLKDGTNNTLTDGKTYNLGDDDSNVDGVIFSRSDLTLNGSGKLTVNANYKHGIVCKDNLVIADGEYEITAASGGIYGKDSIKVNSGHFKINAGSNAVKSSNTEDSESGFIYLKDGEYDITADNDGIEAATNLLIDGGSYTVKTGGGSENASMKSDGKPNDDWGKWGGGPGDADGNTPPEMPDGNKGDMAPPDMNDNNGEPPQKPQDMPEKTEDNSSESKTADESGNDKTTNESNNTEESSSAKGLKAEKEITVNGGSFNIDSSDDAIHCNGDVIISGGDIKASSGDDGTHADGNLVINDGKINIEKSYEGLEGVTVTINGGEIHVTASDDGINAAGGSDTGSEQRMGKDGFNNTDSSKYLLTISGGVTYINASGDGVDSNGNFVMDGGELYVSGPTSDGDGAIDYGDGASAWITGGKIIACGSTGMAEVFGEENSTQYAVLHNLSSKIAGGTTVKITDSDGKELLSFTPEKDYQSVVFSSPEIKQGEYTITAGDVTEKVTVESTITSNGSYGRMGGNGGFGGQPKSDK